MVEKVDILIKNGFVATVDEKRRVFRDGDIAINDDKIVAVDRSSRIEKAFEGEETIDARNMLVMPGLIDAHVHLNQSMLRGCADDVSLITWLNNIWTLLGNYNTSDGKASAMLAMLEMMKSGTTSFIECMIAGRYGFDGIAEAVERFGMRAALSKIIMDLPAYAGKASMYHGLVEEPEKTINEAISMYKKWHGKADGRIQVWFGPRSPGNVSSELYRKIRGLADKYRMRITLHLGEVKHMMEHIKKEFNLLPVEYAHQVGMVGRDVVIAHGIWFSEKDIKILAKTGTHISHCPACNMKLADGIAKVPEMLNAGVNVALGCDGAPSNNTYDMIREMKLAALLSKVRTLDPLVTPAEKVIEMATINGAKAMGLEKEIGSLEVGKKADLILIDMDKPHLTPIYNPISNLVYSASGADVDTVIINGKVLMKHRKVLGMNEEKIIEEAEKRGRQVLKRAKLIIKSGWSRPAGR